ncbi:MAG: Aldehyde dehydrogenase, partial [Streblomastix strix]
MSEVPQPSKTRLQERQEAIEASRAFYTPAAEIQGIVNEMRVNFQTHVTKEYGFRQAQLHGLKQLITERQSEIYDALYKDIHKNETGAYITEIGLVLSEINYAIKNLSSWMVPRKVSNSWVNIPVLTSTKLFPEPLGVTLIISPWNYPILLTLNPLIGAIAAGCSAVIKPSSVTCNVTHLLAQLFPNYLDPKFYRVIEGSHDVSDALLAQKWDKIFFTGSGSIGKE